VGFARWHALCSKLPVVSFPRAQARLLALCQLTLCFAVLSLTSLVQAEATLSLKSQSYRVERPVERLSSEEPYAINRQDCIDDDPTLADFDAAKPVVDKDGVAQGRTWIRFTIYFEGRITNNSRIEIWASQGSDCSDADERKGNGRCRQVYKNPKADTLQVSDVAHVYPRVVMGDRNIEDIDMTDPDDYPTAEVCDEPIDQAYTFYIMLFNGDVVESKVKWTDTRIDLVGPDPPESVSVDAGEAALFVEWTIESEQEDPDTQGFLLYCSPAAELAPSTDGAVGGAGGAAGEAACDSDLVYGKLPKDGSAFECGRVTGRGARKGMASYLMNENGVKEPLRNDVLYAVAVAARDMVNNPGPLSEIQCATPALVTTFFESYKDSGGRGGGGYCAQVALPSKTWPALFLPLLAVSYLRRRSRSLTSALGPTTSSDSRTVS
jgi:hypothetical protein